MESSKRSSLMTVTSELAIVFSGHLQLLPKQSPGIRLTAGLNGESHPAEIDSS
jgi:hypothetical protein